VSPAGIEEGLVRQLAEIQQPFLEAIPSNNQIQDLNAQALAMVMQQLAQGQLRFPASQQKEGESDHDFQVRQQSEWDRILAGLQFRHSKG